VRSLQPDAVIFSDVGPDLRWVGNEKGYAGETCWETFTPVGEDGGPASPGDVRTSESTTGTRSGAQWMPPECDVSIRPGWFWHARENDKVKSGQQILDLYFKSVGRGGSLLLNVPPDRRGLLHENDVASLREFGKLRARLFSSNLAAGARVSASNTRGGFVPENVLDGDRDTYWSTDDHVTTPSLTLDLARRVSFSVIRLRENIRLGQRVESFAVDSWHNSDWHTVAQGTSIGNCRLIRLDEPVAASRVRLRITQSPVCPALSQFALS
jgi:alpha-L-fucosidase